MAQDIDRSDDDADDSPVRTFPKGATIFREGQVSDVAYLIKKGRVSIYRVLNNKRVRLGERGPGEMVGEMGVFTADPRGSTAEANVVLELHVNKAERRGQRLHPIVHVLYAMSCEMLGRDRELALRSLRVATADTLAPAYATFARLGLALFEEADDTETLRRLKEAAAYSGRHEGILHAVAAWIVSTRFGSREEFHAILAHRHFDVSVSEQLQSLYPNTASLLRGKE